MPITPIIADDIVTKVTKIIPRENGSEVKIVAWSTVSPSDGSRQAACDVFKRETPEDNWQYCSDTTHKDWRTMSVDDYNAFGRCEKFQTANHGEILGVSQWIGKPMVEFERAHCA
jgi:hypothetical protein